MRTNLRSPHGGSMLPDMVGAVIYVRVSTKEQTENLSLPTQLKTCEEYCQRQGFHVLARFREEGESAKTADRTELHPRVRRTRSTERVEPLGPVLARSEAACSRCSFRME